MRKNSLLKYLWPPCNLEWKNIKIGDVMKLKYFKVTNYVWLNLKKIQTSRISKKFSWISAKCKVVKVIDSYCVELDTPSVI